MSDWLAGWLTKMYEWKMRVEWKCVVVGFKLYFLFEYGVTLGPAAPKKASKVPPSPQNKAANKRQSESCQAAGKQAYNQSASCFIDFRANNPVQTAIVYIHIPYPLLPLTWTNFQLTVNKDEANKQLYYFSCKNVLYLQMGSNTFAFVNFRCCVS